MSTSKIINNNILWKCCRTYWILFPVLISWFFTSGVNEDLDSFRVSQHMVQQLIKCKFMCCPYLLLYLLPSALHFTLSLKEVLRLKKLMTYILYYCCCQSCSFHIPSIMAQVGIPIAAGVLLPVTGTMLTPSIAGALMGLSSIGVMANSLLLRLKFSSKQKASFQAPSSRVNSNVDSHQLMDLKGK